MAKVNHLAAIIAAAVLAACRFTTTPSATPGVAAAPAASTEFGREAWTDYAIRDAAGLGTDFYVGAWTRVIEEMGHMPNSNDYPFVFPCAETVNGVEQLILTISGNIGFDGGAGSWAYNQNITSNTGDYAGIYIHSGQFPEYPAGQPDEAAQRGWVYVAWHFRRAADGTRVTQYAKFGGSGAVIRQDEDVIDGTGGFTLPLPPPAPEFASPYAICVGGNERGWGTMNMQYAKVYAMADAPSAGQVDAIARRTAPDPAAWADWPLIDADLSDVSGNGRHLTMAGQAHPGPLGPDLRP